MGNVLPMTLGFVVVVILGCSMGNNGNYFFWAWGFIVIALAYGNYSGDNSSNSYIRSSTGYDSNPNWPRKQENNSSVCYYEDSRQDSWSNNRIFDSRGNMVNGKLLEYYRNVEKTGIADTEYEQELKDGYTYCDDHDDYDDCRDD